MTRRTPNSRVVIGVIGAPAGAKLDANGTRVDAQAPGFRSGQTFKVVYAKGSDGRRREARRRR